MKNKILILILIQQWFIDTFKGFKPEEYRAITPYWVKRLMCMENGDALTKCYSEETIAFICRALSGREHHFESIEDIITTFHIRFKTFETTDFRNGYKPLDKVPRFIIENKGITIGKGNADWGYTGHENVFIIHHGRVLESYNIE